LPPDHKEMGRIILPCSVAEYWGLFHQSGCRFGFDAYYTFRGYRKIVISQDWTDGITDPNLKNGWRPSQQWKQISYEVDVQNNPFLKLTPTTKNYLIVEQEPHHMQLRLWTQLKGVPYCDSFNAEEQYAVVSLPRVGSPNLPSNKCAFRISLRMVFHKKIPLFQGKIEKGSLDKGVESFSNWTNWALARLQEHRSVP